MMGWEATAFAGSRLSPVCARCVVVLVLGVEHVMSLRADWRLVMNVQAI